MDRSDCGQTRSRRLFVVGDSHATAYTDTLAMLAVKEQFHVVVYSVPGCAFVRLTQPVADQSAQCAGFNREVEKRLLTEAKPGDLVFLPSFRIARFPEYWEPDARPVEPASAERLAKAYTEAQIFLKALTRRGAMIVLEAPTPVFRSSPYLCSDWFNRSNPACRSGFRVARAEMDARRADVLAAEKRLATEIDKVSVWDPMSVLCGPTVCDAFDEGKPLFFDSDHLSGHGDVVVFASLRDHLAEIGRPTREPAGSTSP